MQQNVIPLHSLRALPCVPRWFMISAPLRDKIKTVPHFAINLLTRNRSMIRYNHRT